MKFSIKFSLRAVCLNYKANYFPFANCNARVVALLIAKESTFFLQIN
jgi:hypothetical protein